MAPATYGHEHVAAAAGKRGTCVVPMVSEFKGNRKASLQISTVALNDQQQWRKASKKLSDKDQGRGYSFPLVYVELADVDALREALRNAAAEAQAMERDAPAPAPEREAQEAREPGSDDDSLCPF